MQKKLAFYGKKFFRPVRASDSIRHSIFCPRRSMWIRPALRSSLIWCEIVEAAIPRSLPRSPTQAHPSELQKSSTEAWIPGWQQESRRMNILSRFGLDNALNISAILSIFVFRVFDIIRNISLDCPLSNKKIISNFRSDIFQTPLTVAKRYYAFYLCLDSHKFFVI